MKMTNVIIAMLAAVSCHAGTTVYRLELTDEVPYVVGGDGVKREVVILDPEEYSAMTGRVDKIWSKMNADPDLRKKLHGKLVNQEVDEVAMVKREYYEDGYISTHKMPKKVTRAKTDRKAVKREKPNRISARQWEMRKRIEDASKGIPREVTVEHDAVTGKDIEK